MALGGGTFTLYNKVLPGTYINFISQSKASVDLADRGYIAVAMELTYGAENEIIELNNDNVLKNSLELLGYSYTDAELKPIRELLLNAKTVYLYRLSKNAVKASCKYGVALYGGERGNKLSIEIKNNVDDSQLKDVTTLMNGIVVDVQSVKNKDELKDNKFVSFKKSDDLEQGVYTFTGGTNGDTITGNEYQEFLNKIDKYYFNILTTPTTDTSIKKLFVAYTKRMREEVGAKFQTVLYRYNEADYEGVVSVQNKVLNETNEALGVLWIAGALGGCPINKSCTNKKYDGEYTFELKENQQELAEAKLSGKLILHMVGDDVKILSDINTFVSFRKDRTKDFSKNQTIRVLDQLAIDMANLFNKKYLGLVPNDGAGRTELWKDVVLLHEKYQQLRAIENFTDKDIKVTSGEEKDQVVINDVIIPVNCMEQLYMTVVVA